MCPYFQIDSYRDWLSWQIELRLNVCVCISIDFKDEKSKGTFCSIRLLIEYRYSKMKQPILTLI